MWVKTGLLLTFENLISNFPPRQDKRTHRNLKPNDQIIESTWADNRLLNASSVRIYWRKQIFILSIDITLKLPSHRWPWGGWPHLSPGSPRLSTCRSGGWQCSWTRTRRRRGSPPPSCQKSWQCHWDASGKHLGKIINIKQEKVAWQGCYNIHGYNTEKLRTFCTFKCSTYNAVIMMKLTVRV